MSNTDNFDINKYPSKCPFLNDVPKKTAGGRTTNCDWWPNELKLNVLRQHAF